MTQPVSRTSFARGLGRLASWVSGSALDLVAVAGAGLIVYGVAQVYRPAGFIVAGGFLLTAAWIYAKKAAA